jgi:hypothetical protein
MEHGRKNGIGKEEIVPKKTRSGAKSIGYGEKTYCFSDYIY